jgi:hypothetical protein
MGKCSIKVVCSDIVIYAYGDLQCSLCRTLHTQHSVKDGCMCVFMSWLWCVKIWLIILGMTSLDAYIVSALLCLIVVLYWFGMLCIVLKFYEESDGVL